MRAVTFYSYKGGVGRTLALANVAEYLVRFNKKVCVLDFDLEAPGLRYKLAEKSNDDVPLQKGIVEYMHYFFEFTKQSALPESLDKYSQEVVFKGHKDNPVIFIPAGNSEMASYWNKLSQLDWNSYFNNKKSKGYGNLFFLELKERIKHELKPDILLIDCRTGISTVFGITNAILSEYSIVLSANNNENLDGSIMVLDNLSKPKNHLLKKKRKLHFVLTRIPYPKNKAEEIREENRLKYVKDKLDKELPKNTIDKVMVIHSDRELEWGDKQEILDDRKRPITRDYIRLFGVITDDFLTKEELEEAKKIEKSAELLNQARSEKDPEKQIEMLTEALKLDTENYDALFERAYVYQTKLNRFNKALEDYTLYLEKNPEDIGAYNNRGFVYKILELYEAALKDYDRAIALNPEAAIAYNSRGNAYFDLEKYENALEDYNIAIALNPEYAKAYSNRGNAYSRLEKYENALEDYDRAILLNLEYAEVYNNRGAAYDNLGKYENALEDYGRAIELNPEYEVFYNNRGYTYDNLNQYEAALKDYDKTLELNPDYEKAKNNRKNLLEKMKKKNG